MFDVVPPRSPESAASSLSLPVSRIWTSPPTQRHRQSQASGHSAGGYKVCGGWTCCHTPGDTSRFRRTIFILPFLTMPVSAAPLRRLSHASKAFCADPTMAAPPASTALPTQAPNTKAWPRRAEVHVAITRPHGYVITRKKPNECYPRKIRLRSSHQSRRNPPMTPDSHGLASKIAEPIHTRRIPVRRVSPSPRFSCRPLRSELYIAQPH